MSNNIDTRAPFFPRSKSATSVEQGKAGSVGNVGAGNSPERAGEIAGRTSGDAKVSIPDGVREFSRIKKAADAAPEQDNSAKIADLKARIAAGSYEIDYDGLADKMLQSDF